MCKDSWVARRVGADNHATVTVALVGATVNAIAYLNFFMSAVPL